MRGYHGRPARRLRESFRGLEEAESLARPPLGLRETKKIPLKLGGLKNNLSCLKQRLIPSQS